MIRLELKIIDESSGEILRETRAYVDMRFGQVCLDALNKMSADAVVWLRHILDEQS